MSRSIPVVGCFKLSAQRFKVILVSRNVLFIVLSRQPLAWLPDGTAGEPVARKHKSTQSKITGKEKRNPEPKLINLSTNRGAVTNCAQCIHGLKTPNPKREIHNLKPSTRLAHKLMNTTSQDRITANRANALKSTGPKTSEGKAASKMNAVKHGIRSREVLVAGEDHQELTALQEWFEEDLQPVGPLEVMLVGQIVATHWRLRRVLAAESGEIKREAELKDASATSNALPSTIEDTAEGCRLLQTWLSDTMLA